MSEKTGVCKPFQTLKQKMGAKSSTGGKRGMLKSAQNPFFTIFHPFDASYEINRRGAGNVWYTVLILAAWFIADVFQRQNTGYIFNDNKLSDLNVWLELLKVLAPFAMWVVSNWVISILMNGTGKFRDIWIYSAYIAIPYIIGLFAYVALSNVLAQGEPFHQYVLIFGTAWSLIDLVIGMMVMHEYRFSQNLLACLLSVCVMALLLFIIMLGGSLLSEFISFVRTVYMEIMFRL